MVRDILLVAFLGSAMMSLSACGDGNPFEDTDPDDDDDNGTGLGLGAPGTSQTDPLPPATQDESSITAPSVAHNLYAVTYNPDANGGDGSLRLDLRSLDASVVNAAYVRDETRDIEGYRAFTYQEPDVGASSRVFLAYVAESASGSLTATTVGDGGQFNRSVGGSLFERSGGFALPATGLAGFAGEYAGVITVDTTGEVEYYVADSDLPSATYPYHPSRVIGQVFIIADFANRTVNGTIYNRDIVEDAYTLMLPDEYDLVDLALTAIDMDEDGLFINGGVEELNVPGSDMGSWGGVIGANGAEIAGAIFINPYIDNTKIWEHGIFVLSACNGSTCPTP